MTSVFEPFYASDILGAARAGIKSCWINRSGQPRELEVKPDVTAGTLEEAYKLISSEH